MTLLEVLIATILAAGALATLSTWAYKAPWNQAPRRKLRAQQELEKGMKARLATPPVGLEELVPLDGGWSVRWRWYPMPGHGWSLCGEVLDAHGTMVRKAWMARWWP